MGKFGDKFVDQITTGSDDDKKKCAFIFNTGTDKLLHSMVDEYIKLLRRMKRGRFDSQEFRLD